MTNTALPQYAGGDAAPAFAGINPAAPAMPDPVRVVRAGGADVDAEVFDNGLHVAAQLVEPAGNPVLVGYSVSGPNYLQRCSGSKHALTQVPVSARRFRKAWAAFLVLHTLDRHVANAFCSARQALMENGSGEQVTAGSHWCNAAGTRLWTK